jgi:hypothetical protein
MESPVVELVLLTGSCANLLAATRSQHRAPGDYSVNTKARLAGSDIAATTVTVVASANRKRFDRDRAFSQAACSMAGQCADRALAGATGRRGGDNLTP